MPRRAPDEAAAGRVGGRRRRAAVALQVLLSETTPERTADETTPEKFAEPDARGDDAQRGRREPPCPANCTDKDPASCPSWAASGAAHRQPRLHARAVRVLVRLVRPSRLQGAVQARPRRRARRPARRDGRDLRTDPLRLPAAAADGAVTRPVAAPARRLPRRRGGGGVRAAGQLEGLRDERRHGQDAGGRLVREHLLVAPHVADRVDGHVAVARRRRAQPRDGARGERDARADEPLRVRAGAPVRSSASTTRATTTTTRRTRSCRAARACTRCSCTSPTSTRAARPPSSG